MLWVGDSTLDPLSLHSLTPSPQPPSQHYIPYLYANVESVSKLENQNCYHGTNAFETFDVRKQKNQF